MDKETLYEGENDSRKAFDGVTGEELNTSLEATQTQAVAKATVDAEALISLSAHPGWELIRLAMEHDILEGQEKLLYSGSPELTLKVQEFVKSRKSLLSWIDMKILEGKTLIQEQQGPTEVG